ncbi:hypothetical protein HDU79_002500 [Rhizoclosmatium sp. JEL0117]|nr:hypothetical protein HDU79_002500 [Rhizoclosmatium sp. JEL0117]
MKLSVFLPVLIALVERVVAAPAVWGAATGGQVGIFSDKACSTLVQVSIVGGSNQVFTPAASTTCTAGTGTWANFYLQKITASSSTSTTEGSLVTVPFWNSYDGYANILTYTDPTASPNCNAPAQNTAAAMGGQVPFKAGTCTVLSVPVGEVKAIKFTSGTGLTLWSTTDCTTTQVGSAVATGSNVATSALTQALLPSAATGANCLALTSSPTYGYIALVGKPMVQGAVTLYGYYSDSGCSSLVDYWLIGTALTTAATTSCSSSAPYYKFPVSSSASAVTEASAFTTTQFDASSLYDGYAVIMSYSAAACPSASVATGSATTSAGVVAPFKAGGACVALSGTSSTIALGGASYKYTTSGGFILYSDNACATALAPFTSAVFVLGQPAMCLNNLASSPTASYWVNLVASKAASVSVTSKSGAYSNITPFMAGSALLMAALV